MLVNAIDRESVRCRIEAMEDLRFATYAEDKDFKKAVREMRASINPRRPRAQRS